ncbi:MAG: amino acid--tRNA ligase-related protein [Candidatus Nanohaloarchaea archaeon]|nr:amino acid--tRNA ligase-related protein [Candidatus Nanohaloarchaea archaeon]
MGGLANEDTIYEFEPDKVEDYSALLSSLRGYMRDRGFLEVETPVLTPQKLGFNPPLSVEEELNGESYSLRTAPMVSPLMGDVPKFFELGRSFREESGDSSSPEYNVHLFVESGADYGKGMELFQSLVVNAAEAVNGDAEIGYQGESFDLSDWQVIEWEDAFEEFADIGREVYQSPERLEHFVEEELDVDPSDSPFSDSYNHLYHDFLLDTVLEEIEEDFREPVILRNPPYHFEVPARPAEDGEHKQTADPYVAGMELGHIRTVETDGEELREWHERMARLKQERGVEDAFDEDYLSVMDELEDEPVMLGAIGVDRLAMLLLDEDSVDGVKNYRF